MTDIQNEIDALVRAFVAQLNALFAKHARAAFERAVLGPSTDVRTEATPVKALVAPKASVRKGRRRAAKPKAPAAAQPKVVAPTKPQRREIAPQNLPEYLAANPGQRMDQLSKSLGLPVPKLQAAISSLMASGVVRREGERRGVKYYVVA